MIPYTQEAHGVLALRLYQPADCQAILSRIRNLEDWSTAQVQLDLGDGQQQAFTRPEIRSANILNDSPHARDIFEHFNARMESLVLPLIRQFWGVELTEYSGTQVLRYPPGGHYLPHQDSGPGLESRYFTVACYLNDDFEGGCTRFPSLDHSAVPETGKAILFPANFFHCAESVLRGEKFAIISWVHGPVPIRWI